MAVAYLVYRTGFGGAGGAAIPVSEGAAAGANVVLITLDTLRADRVECYGYDGVETPNLNALAARGIRFEDAVASVPLTLPSHASILTGNYPPTHGVRDNGIHRLTPGHTTLAERLQEEGYTTAAFVASFVLDRRYGTDQGFDVYDDIINTGDPDSSHWQSRPERRGDRVVDSAMGWLEENERTGEGRPFFLWLHLYDPHEPYDPPQPFKSRYAGNGYDGEVAFTDQQVGRLVDRLRSLELLDDTLLVVVGDHGEGLGEHGEQTHGRLIYETTMRVPLIFHAPSVLPEGRVVDDRVVATVDIAPTLMDLLGIAPFDCDGVSLLLRPTDDDRSIYIETLTPNLKHGWAPLHGLRRHTDKFIQAPTPEYYDLADDPTETLNLYNHDEKAERLEAELAAMLESFPTAANAGVEVDPVAARNLAALGYVAAESLPVEGRPLLADPKEMVALWDRRTAQAKALLEKKQFAEALSLLEEMVADMPGDSDLWSMLAVAQADGAQFDDAIQSRLKSIELHPTEVNHWIHLAQLQFATGDREAFETSLTEAERLEGDHGGIHLLRARQAFDAELYEEAVAFCEQARRIDPSRSAFSSWSLQGQIYKAMGQMDRAGTAFTKAAEINPSNTDVQMELADLNLQSGPGAALELGIALLRQGKVGEAVRLFEEGLREDPTNAHAWQSLGIARASMGQLQEASTAFEQALRHDPELTEASVNLSRAYREMNRHGDALEVLQRASRLAPNNTSILAALAWLLATSPDSALRDGLRAVELAERAVAGANRSDLRVLESLAAAYAEAGRFDRAVAVAEQALELARSARQDRLVRQIQARLELYRAHRPYRISPP